MLWVSKEIMCLLRPSNMTLCKAKRQIELCARGKLYSVACNAVHFPTSYFYTGFYWCFGYDIILIGDHCYQITSITKV